MRNVLILLASAVLAVGLPGCGNDSEPASGVGAGAEGSAPVVGPAAEKSACDLVTQADASALFGQPASPQTGYQGAAMFDQCLWTWDTETANQLLQFSIWDVRAYSPPEDSEPIALGQQGFVRVHPLAGVDVGWIQDDRMISLAYSTVGAEVPRAETKAEQVKELARLIERRLK